MKGHLNEEEEVLQWLITQKTEDRIELITRQMLETMVEDTQYLAVYFCKSIPNILPISSRILLFCQSFRVFPQNHTEFVFVTYFSFPELEA